MSRDPRDDAEVTRFVVTHVQRDGMRTLTLGGQGRWTYATREEAEAMLHAITDNNTAECLAGIYGEQAPGTFEVRPCECWPGHFDPKGVWFD